MVATGPVPPVVREGIALPPLRYGRAGPGVQHLGSLLEPAVPVRQSSPLWGAFRIKVCRVNRPRTWSCAVTTGSPIGWPPNSGVSTANRSRSSCRPRGDGCGSRWSDGPVPPRRHCSTGSTRPSTGRARAANRPGTSRSWRLREITEAVLTEVGADRAAALALVYDDDETNIRAALTARRLNPRLRLVLRLYNRRLGQHIEELLDQTAAVASGTGPGIGPRHVDDRAVRRRHGRARAGRHRPRRHQQGRPDGRARAARGGAAAAAAGRGGRPGAVHPGAAVRDEQRPGRARTVPRAAGSTGRSCCRTRRRWPRRPGAGPWSWSRCRTPGRPCPPGGAVCRRSPRCSRGGCGGRWRGWSGACSRSPSP